MIDEKQMALAVDMRGQTSLVGWYASEKLNGCRVYWDGEKLWTRGGVAINAPDWFTKDLPAGIHLDGEIHAGRGAGFGNDNTAYKVAMTAVVHGGKWFEKTAMHNRRRVPIRFTVFDAPNFVDCDWDERLLSVFHCVGGDHANVIARFKIQDPMHLVKYMMELKRLGAEGAMFRNADEIGYHAGRTGSLLRWKFEK